MLYFTSLRGFCYAALMQMRVVMLGDIVGRVGRLAVMQAIPLLRERFTPDLIIANAENAASGSGLTPEQYHKLMGAGLDGITLGDHVYKRREIMKVMEAQRQLVRPANLPAAAKGARWMKLQPAQAALPPLFVLTLLGRTFMNLPCDDPFATLDAVLAELPQRDPLVLLEVHAEATSEKQALAWYANGRVAAVLGSHTHVATADARLLPTRGHDAPVTAYQTDLGMCGPWTSVIGRKVDPVLFHLTTAMPEPFDVSEEDPRVSGVCVTIDVTTRSAVAIERFDLSANTSAPPFTAH